MNNLAKPIIQDELGFEGDQFNEVLANQNVAFGIGKVLFSIIAGGLADKFGRRNLLLSSEVFN